MNLVILDRDGVINRERDDFVKSPDEWVPLPGSLEALAKLHQAGWTVAVASNQSGVARGLIAPEVLEAIHARMRRAVEEAGGHLDAIFHCPHGPEDGCTCRKPRPGLFQRIVRHYRTELKDVPCLGDRRRDLEAAVASGGQPVLVLTGKGMDTVRAGQLPPGTMVFPDLAGFVDWRLASSGCLAPGWPVEVEKKRRIGESEFSAA